MSARRLLVPAVLAALSTAVAVAVAASGPVPVSPKNGARLPAGKAVTFKARSSGEGTVWVHVSKSRKRNREGVIAHDAFIGQMKRKGRLWVLKAKVYGYPAHWLNQKRTWYWQTHRIACEGDTSDCRQEGPIRRLRLR